MIQQSDFAIPLIDKAEPYNAIILLAEKCEKKCNKSSKLDSAGLKEIGRLINEISKWYSDILSSNAEGKKKESNQGSQFSNINFLLKINSFITVTKDKLNHQLTKALKVQNINKKLLDSDDEEDISSNSSYYKNEEDEIAKNIVDLKEVVKCIEELELKVDVQRKKIGNTEIFLRDDFRATVSSNDGKMTSEGGKVLNEQYRNMNKYMGLITLLCISTSFIILVIVVLKKINLM